MFVIYIGKLAGICEPIAFHKTSCAQMASDVNASKGIEPRIGCSDQPGRLWADCVNTYAYRKELEALNWAIKVPITDGVTRCQCVFEKATNEEFP